MKDQRRYPRFRQQVVITFEESPSSEEVSIQNEWPAWLINISLSGAAVETPHRVNIGTRLLVEIPFKPVDGVDNSLSLNANVRRAEHIEETNEYVLGIEFQDMDDQDVDRLNDFVVLQKSQGDGSPV